MCLSLLNVTLQEHRFNLNKQHQNYTLWSLYLFYRPLYPNRVKSKVGLGVIRTQNIMAGQVLLWRPAVEVSMHKIYKASIHLSNVLGRHLNVTHSPSRPDAPVNRASLIVSWEREIGGKDRARKKERERERWCFLSRSQRAIACTWNNLLYYTASYFFSDVICSCWSYWCGCWCSHYYYCYCWSYSRMHFSFYGGVSVLFVAIVVAAAQAVTAVVAAGLTVNVMTKLLLFSLPWNNFVHVAIVLYPFFLSFRFIASCTF